MHTAYDLDTTPEELLQALLTHIRAVVSKVTRKGVATALAVAQLQFGGAVNVRVVEQNFLPGSDDNEIDDLIESLRPTANGILAKLNMEQLLHARLDP